jgi:hypothetical protein
MYITKKTVFLVIFTVFIERLLIVCTVEIFLFSSGFTFFREVLTDMKKSRVSLIDFFFPFIGSFLFSVISSSSPDSVIGIISFFLFPFFDPSFLFLDYFNFILITHVTRFFNIHVIVREKIVKLGKIKKK